MIDDLSSFEHPFAKSLKLGKGIDELAEEIRLDGGVEQPVLLRLKENGRYETIAGHRRKRACLILGMRTIPAVIKDYDDDRAKLIVNHTNLGARAEILPSEKAKVLLAEVIEPIDV